MKYQNILIWIASYFFYGWWDWRFLILIAFSTVTDFITAGQIYKSPSPVVRKRWLWLSLVLNLGILFFFKYFNFFISTWIDFLAQFNIQADVRLWSIVLPVGISFYTFQTLSYVIDVYQGKLKPADSLVDFAAYVSFFPQLVAGPIERATNLLPQFARARVFNVHQATIGVKLALCGLFKKVVVADNCAVFVNEIWVNHSQTSGETLVVGVILFAFQIYCDFSGYSDIALGTAKMLGFELMTNFRTPYFSKSIVEFWQRWHISLTSWFRDYVYIPLGGSKKGEGARVRNTFIVFLASGLWHGANLTFIAWGFINALFFIPYMLSARNSQTQASDRSLIGNVKTFFQVVFTFGLVCFGWIFFRSDSITQAIQFIGECFSWFDPLSFFTKTNTHTLTFSITIFSILELMVIEKWMESRPFNDSRGWKSIVVFSALVVQICFLGSFKNQLDFIYFQF